MKFLGYSKNEAFIVAVIIFGIITATVVNLKTSYRRSRNVTRKNDIRTIHDGLIAYRDDYANFPESDQGKIVACFGGVDTENNPQRVICEWARDPLPDLFNMNKADNYLRTLPSDPKHIEGRRYLYLSNGRYFQLYGSLEGSDEDEYRQDVVKRDLKCGDEICNFGRSSDNAPLEKSIEEYENELRAK